MTYHIRKVTTEQNQEYLAYIDSIQRDSQEQALELSILDIMPIKCETVCTRKR